MTTCDIPQGRGETGHQAASQFHLDQLDRKDWVALDVSQFLVDHLDCFCAKLYHRYPEFERAELRSIFVEQALPRLRRTHSRHLDAEGDDRNRIMGAAARQIVRHIMAGEGGMEAWYRYFSQFCTVDPLDFERPVDDTTGSGFQWYYCSEMSAPAPDALDEDSAAMLEREHFTRVKCLENARGHLTTHQYEILYKVIMTNTPTGDLARERGITPSAIGRVRRQARQRIERAAREGRIKKG